MITNLHIEEFIKQAHRVGEAGLTICSSGNLSWRIGDEALVSGTGSWVPTLQKEKVSQCTVATGEVLNGVKPSMESGFHLGVLRARPDVNVVLHFQSPYATAVSCMKKKPVREYLAEIGVKLIEQNDYALRPFVRAVADDIARRCIKCYEMRLFETARVAKEQGFDAFTSSLFISPYQNHGMMMEVAQRAAEAYGVEFLYRDFRPLFKEGQEFAREHGFYMQKYCGCVFSEEERYLKAKKIIP